MQLFTNMPIVFKFKWNLLVQVVGTLIQFIGVVSPHLPPKGQAVLALAVGVLQAASALAAHFVNPDGTPAEEPYKKGG